MKSVVVSIVLLGCFIAVLGDNSEEGEEITKKVMELADNCATEGELSPEERNKVMTGDSDSPTEKIKCFYKCFFDKVGENNNEMNSKFKEKMKEIVAECKSTTTGDDCDAAYAIALCIHKNM